MKKRILKKTFSAVLAGCMVLTGIPGGQSRGLLDALRPSVSEVYAAEPGYSFDEASGVLTLKGNVPAEAFKSFSSKEAVKSITAALGTVLPENCNNLFINFSKCTAIDLSKADTSKVTIMSGMFQNCYALTSLNISSFNTIHVTDMSYMFASCRKLESLYLGTFMTSGVTDMSGMFSDCYALKSLNLSSFNTAKVTDMSLMFFRCEALEELDLSRFSTEQVTNMSGMFIQNYKLKSLSLTSFNTEKVTDMGSMFYECTALETLDLSSFNTAVCKKYTNMFLKCRNLTELDLSGFNMSNVTDEAVRQCFSECTALKKLTLGEKIERISQIMALPNGDGWFNANAPKVCVSGSGEIAALPNTGKNVYVRSPEIAPERFDLSGAVFPAPGRTVKDSLESLSADDERFTIDKDHIYWIDASTRKIMSGDAVFRFGGAYILQVNLDPAEDYSLPKMSEIPEDFSCIYAGDGTTVLLKGVPKSALITTWGSLDFFAAPAVCCKEDVYVTFNEVSEYSISVLTEPQITTPDAHSVKVSTAFNEPAYQAVTGAPDYVCSIDGENWYRYADIKDTGITKLKPDTEYTLYMKTADAEEPLYSTTFRTPVSEEPEPVYSIDITNLVEPRAGEKPDKTVKVPDGTLLGNYGLKWLHGDASGNVMQSEETFTNGALYTVQVSVIADEGYVFPDDLSEITATVNGNAASVSLAENGKDIIVSCPFTARRYIAAFYPGKGGSGSMEPLTGEFREEITLPECSFTAPLGKRFTGWEHTHTIHHYSIIYQPGDTVQFYNKDMSFTAQWETYSVAVTFDANGGTGSMESVTCPASEEITLPECGFTPPENSYFTGWKIGDKTYQPNEKIQPLDDTTVCAVWKSFDYTVSFLPNGGTGSMADTVIHVSQYPLPECTFTAPENKVFAGWLIEGQTVPAGETVAVSGDFTLCAIWEYALLSAEYDANGGAGSMPDTVLLSGTAFAFPACTFTAPEGKQFAGWQLGDKTYQPGDSVKITKNETVKALWKDASVTVLIGDVSGDGTVDPLDAILLSRYAAAWDGVELNLKAADLNADGTVDNADAMILARYVAAWEGYDRYIVSKTV